ncbi:dimethylguanosine tRNA methyltransferase [Grosmannia clavigera kw1407]|uniref:tRNA (guanine(26)-N(2))-dimethyltransferase n=1 Tax=Grosmannia clavigera (strain kw1407 / UAMH 11150) TaxID=655863 RepID=F0X959_GROCL|nr:dimethylguanosine tRNA methyltransferase [Grosmannia clavigera kw1407]EFX05420.1 dimethylguanosine tRNA methyltransferase [Grosmannia clavigera kw1407]
MATSSTQTDGQNGHQDDNVTIGPDGKRYRTAREGLARIYVPLSDGEKTRQNGGGGPAVEDHAQQVFYNPIQQFNRDLSVLAIKAYGQAKLEERAERFAKKKEVFAQKKRKQVADRRGDKRKRENEDEADEGERPVKVGKQSDDSARAEAEAEAEAEAGTADGQESRDPEADSAETASTCTSTSAGPAPIRILDALSATGLRALRYAHELPFAVSVTANDLLAAATKSIRRNVELNGLSDKITVRQSDALAHMYTVVAKELTLEAAGGGSNKVPNRSEKYDVIDLDPYGTAATFFDAAVQSVRNDGGLLCVTCTDAGVWASQGYPEKCYALYGGVPMKGSQSHEAGLRIVLQALSVSAARYGLAVTPQLSLSIDFYCRVFVTVRRSPASVKFLAGRTMTAYNCDQGCGAWTTQPLLRNRATANKRGDGHFYKHTFATAPQTDAFCPHCHTKTHLAGPMFAGPIHSAPFIRRILEELPQAPTDVYGTTERIRGMLQTALEELVEGEVGGEDHLAALDPMPFFFLPSNLAKVVHCMTPNEDAMRGALVRLGYRATRSHCRPGSIKTDAPWSVLWDVMRAWVRQKAPVKPESIRPGTPAERLLRLGSSGEGSERTEKEEKVETVETTETTETTEKESKLEIVFDETQGHKRIRGADKLVRYQINPRENWGPMNRARGH